MAGKYAVPAEIRATKPKGTMVKKIPGGYYVYEYRTVRDGDGRRRTKMGSCIGKIDPVRGFVPNSASLRQQGWRTLEFGQWAVADDLSQGTHALLSRSFPASLSAPIRIRRRSWTVEARSASAGSRAWRPPCSRIRLRGRQRGARPAWESPSRPIPGAPIL